VGTLRASRSGRRSDDPDRPEDEEPPDGLDDRRLYVAVPTKRELDLGRSGALSFAEEHLPQSRDVILGYFAQRGAYSRFQALLERTDRLEAWHRFERATIERRLSDWCKEHGLEIPSTQSGH